MTRLLSPRKNRIYPNAMTGMNQGDTRNSSNRRRRELEDKKPGEADLMTITALKNAGWTDYDGTAQTDNRGFVVPGTEDW